MPDWQPNWDDVDFDHARTQAAIDECERAAGALDTVVDGLHGAHRQLDSDGAWRGRYRDDYDTEQPAIVDDAVATRDALRALALAISDAAGAATAEQARREADRERWREERDRELAQQGYARLPSGKLVPI
ncbi:MAG TPA: hypothetical protein VE575_14335 [Acidimicrobiales bacterium]|jgi:post-segregation antitoxin (ccd killing protein)|nr:hypothetical protein [Acidimicrobiales bacterium]